MSPRVPTRLLAAQPDERLVALVRDGHERAFEAVVHRYRRPLLRYCRRLSLSESRAEDVLQQSMLNAWVALRRGAEVRELRPWLYRIVHNVAVNAMRGERQTDLGLTDDEVSGEPVVGTLAARGSVDDAIALADAFAGMAELPRLQREVMVRTAVGGHSHDEVASELGITDGAVRGLLYRARAQLRAAAAAVMPPPMVAWAAGSAVQGASGGERIAEIATSGGAVGVASIAVKGGIVALTAGAAITGAFVARGHHSAATTRSPKVAASGSSGGGGGGVSGVGDGGPAGLAGGMTSDAFASLGSEGDTGSRHVRRTATKRRFDSPDRHRLRRGGEGGRSVGPIVVSAPPQTRSTSTDLQTWSDTGSQRTDGYVGKRTSDLSAGGDRPSLQQSDRPAGGSGGDRRRLGGKDEAPLGGDASASEGGSGSGEGGTGGSDAASVESSDAEPAEAGGAEAEGSDAESAEASGSGDGESTEGGEAQTHD